jgi:6-phosphogluconate dehydrogenase
LTTHKADIGVIGLAVMGQNLVLNMNDHGYSVAVFNRSTEKVTAFLAGEAHGRDIIGTYSLQELISSLKAPRKVMLMIKAGAPVDASIDALTPLLAPGDIIIDGGNSNYQDSTRRMNELAKKGILFIGAGISGGELGARFGPSIMPGGAEAGWPEVKPIFQAIAAKVSDGSPCCEWLGPEGAGHFVKMVHNGIEYGDMQLICEAYDLMKTGLGLTNQEISEVFEHWSQGKLNSYLIEITANILRYRDEQGVYVVDQILDAAKQKGTGKWTAEVALDNGAPLTLIGEAVFARFLSAMKFERVRASQYFDIKPVLYSGSVPQFIQAIHDALYASKIVSYAQGYMLFKSAEGKYGWQLPYGTIAMLWQEGCIIRAEFLEKVRAAYDQNPGLNNLLLDPYFKDAVMTSQQGWRQVVSQAAQMGIAVPAMSSALAFFDGYRRERLPANLLQAQRDYFGAHTYERIDQPRGEYFHTNWTGEGGDVTASTYDVMRPDKA